MIFPTSWAGTFITIKNKRFVGPIDRIQCRQGADVVFVVFNNDARPYKVAISKIGPKYGRPGKQPFEEPNISVEVPAGHFGIMRGRIAGGSSGLYKYSLKASGPTGTFSRDPDIEVDPGSGMNSGPNTP